MTLTSPESIKTSNPKPSKEKETPMVEADAKRIDT